MAHRVTCIIPDGHDSDQRIDAIGGTNADSSRWQLAIDEAIAGIETGKWSFYVSVNGRSVGVIVARRPNGRKYLKTEADNYEPNNLLSLPTCP